MLRISSTTWQIVKITPAFTGGLCFHCGRQPYYQWITLSRNGLEIKLCVCYRCLMIGPEKLLKPILKWEKKRKGKKNEKNY